MVQVLQGLWPVACRSEAALAQIAERLPPARDLGRQQPPFQTRQTSTFTARNLESVKATCSRLQQNAVETARRLDAQRKDD